jgi:Family of unknown function (DUF5706)
VHFKVILKLCIMTQIKTTPAGINSGKHFILDTARNYAAGLWSDQREKRWLYHNYAQAAGVVRYVELIGTHAQISDDMVEIATLAGWFFNTGYLYDAAQMAEKSALAAEFFLAEHRYDPEKIHRVHQCIITTLKGMHPKTKEAQLLNDAITAYDLVEQWPQRLNLLRAENEIVSGIKMAEGEWLRTTFQALHEAVFFLPYSKEHFEPKLSEHFLQAKNNLELHIINGQATKEKAVKTTITGAPDDALFTKVSGKKLRSAIQTYFRSNYNNHIHLSAIADNKAHIMISVNSILLSVAISVLTYHTYTDRNPLLVLPVVIFLVTGLTSLIFAVLSSRPRIQSAPPSREKGKTNWMFFGNFIHLSVDEYEQEVDQLLQDGAALYGNMTRDTYYLGKVLDKKYRLLTVSYNVFMLGFVATVVSYLVAYFMQG